MSDASTVVAPSSKLPIAVKRRRYQFSLRSLIFWFLFLGLVLGVLGRWVHRTREQAARVATLRSFGVEVFYSGQISTDGYGRVWHHGGWRKSFAARELERWFGIDCIGTVQGLRTNASLHTISGEREEFWRLAKLFPELSVLEVSNAWCDSTGLAQLRDKSSLRVLTIVNSKVTNDDLVIIGTLTGLQSLSLQYVPSDSSILNDRGVAHLTTLEDLRHLQLDFVGMNDASLPRLAVFTRLKALSLSKASVTDQGARFLARLTDLEVLELRQTRISDRGLAALSGLTNLKYLGLGGTLVTDDGLQHLQYLHDLETLNVSETKIHGPGFVHLHSLPVLKRIWLRSNPIEDDDLKYFEGLRHVEEICLRKSRVSNAGIKSFRLPPSARAIDLSDTRVADDGMMSLLRYPWIRELRVQRSEITPEGIVEFKKAAPECDFLPSF